MPHTPPEGIPKPGWKPFIRKGWYAESLEKGIHVIREFNERGIYIDSYESRDPVEPERHFRESGAILITPTTLLLLDAQQLRFPF